MSSHDRGSSTSGGGPPGCNIKDVLPDPGCYQQSYRLIGRVAWPLAAIAAFLAVAVLVPEALPAQLIALALTIPAALPRLIEPVSRRIAFAPTPAAWPVRVACPPRRCGVPPSGRRSRRSSSARGPDTPLAARPVHRVQRRQRAPDLPRGNEPAPGCPVPGVAAGATRPVTGWQLEREHLAAVTAAVAPGVPVIDTSAGPDRRHRKTSPGRTPMKPSRLLHGGSPRANLTIGGILLAAGLWSLFFVLFRSENLPFTVAAALLLLAGSFNIWQGFTQLRTQRPGTGPGREGIPRDHRG